MRLLLIALAAQTIAVTGCGDDQLPPIARFSMSHAWLCEGQPRQRVDFNAAGSLDRNGKPSNQLSFAWHFTPPPLEVITGTWTSKRIIVSFDATGPVLVQLTLTDAAGGTARRTRTVGLSLTTPTPCGVGCEPHEICVSAGGTDVCVDDLVCYSDDICGECLPCTPDDAGVGRCMAAPIE